MAIPLAKTKATKLKVMKQKMMKQKVMKLNPQQVMMKIPTYSVASSTTLVSETTNLLVLNINSTTQQQTQITSPSSVKINGKYLILVRDLHLVNTYL